MQLFRWKTHFSGFIWIGLKSPIKKNCFVPLKQGGQVLPLWYSYTLSWWIMCSNVCLGILGSFSFNFIIAQVKMCTALGVDKGWEFQFKTGQEEPSLKYMCINLFAKTRFKCPKFWLPSHFVIFLVNQCA